MLVPASAAQGHTKKYPTNISKVKRELVTGVGYRYYGTIGSSEPACEKRRIVTVFTNVTEPSAEDRTNSKGKWEIISTFGSQTETFVTVSGSTVVSNSQHKHTCKTAQGSTVFTDSIVPDFR